MYKCELKHEHAELVDLYYPKIRRSEATEYKTLETSCDHYDDNQ